MKFPVTFIGDIHGDTETHKKLMREHHRTLQLGDLGFDYRYLIAFDGRLHKFVGGNHDNYDEVNKYEHYTGDISIIWDRVLTIRGACSIDRNFRTEGKDWWRQEEMEYAQFLAGLDFIVDAGPDVIASHDCPSFIAKTFYSASENLGLSRTQAFLDAVWSDIKPKIWIFGHHHKSRVMRVGNTIFHALDIAEPHTIDLDSI